MFMVFGEMKVFRKSASTARLSQGVGTQQADTAARASADVSFWQITFLDLNDSTSSAAGGETSVNLQQMTCEAWARSVLVESAY